MHPARLSLIDVFEDAGVSGKSLKGRLELTRALHVVESGQAAVLFVANLDRLGRSVHDASGLLDRAERGGWLVVALDLGES